MQRSYGTRICLFDQTPEGIICPHFYELRWARGCPLDCSYCYLQLTYRIQGKEPKKYPWREVEKSLDLFFKKVEDPHLLNSGELADSLMYPDYMRVIADKFETQNRHKLLLLSKLGTPRRVKFLREKSHKQTVVSFSINTPRIARWFENSAPPPNHRIGTAYLLKKKGYEVRVRLDPIIPMYFPEYFDLLDTLFSELTPDRITLGTLRVFPPLLSLGEGGSWAIWLDTNKRHADGRYRLSDQVRFEIYASLIYHLEKNHNYHNVALCKETLEMWKLLNLNSDDCKCNCVL